MDNLVINFIFLSVPLFVSVFIVLLIFTLRTLRQKRNIYQGNMKMKIGLLVIIIIILVIPFLYSYFDGLSLRLEYLGMNKLGTESPNMNYGDWGFIRSEEEQKNIENKLDINLTYDINYSKEMELVSYGRKIYKINYSLFSRWFNNNLPVTIFADNKNESDSIFIYKVDDNFSPSEQGSSYRINR